jgi:hypothetical protein
MRFQLSDMLTGLTSGQDMSKRVVITFDDGYRDFLTGGFAVMKQCGLSSGTRWDNQETNLSPGNEDFIELF